MQDQTFLDVIKKSLIFASLVGGVYFIIKSFANPAVTGAVIGNRELDPYILVTTTLFLFALALNYFTK